MGRETSRAKEAVRNSAVGFACQIVSIVVQFLMRSVFIKYLGVEMLGIGSTFTSVLSTLSLAELGFQTAIVYNLYKPLADRDEAKINDTVNVLKTIYRFVGCFFIIAGLLCLPFLSFILKGVEVNNYIRLIFMVQVSNSAASYFLAYKRSLIYSDKRDYISYITDVVVNVIMDIVKMVVVVMTSSYLLYVILTTVQTVISNVVIHIISRRLYPYLKKTKFNKEIFGNVMANVKNLFVGKIAYYVYSSTAPLVVSSLVSAVSVGFMVNYTTVITSLKKLTNSILNPITPIIGNLLASNKDEGHGEDILRTYTYIRFVIAGVIIVPLSVLIQSFITWWIGAAYILPMIIVVLYCIDFYIHIVHSALCDFINGNGMFKQDKNIEIIGAVSNLVVAVSMALILRNVSPEMGIAGVLLGTAVSQVAFWISRSVVVYKKCFATQKGALLKYWRNNICYILIFIIIATLASIIYNIIPISSFILKFIIGGIICECLFVLALFTVFGRTRPHREAMKLVKGTVLRKFIRK